ncbi:hypothetical protein PENSPDRAFT_660554 [Peniophora sp. CONT]|nr:hypothetical protein PENSPDRAFT_660554 [Peniophora sp. CONT]
MPYPRSNHDDKEGKRAVMTIAQRIKLQDVMVLYINPVHKESENIATAGFSIRIRSIHHGRFNQPRLKSSDMDWSGTDDGTGSGRNRAKICLSASTIIMSTPPEDSMLWHELRLLRARIASLEAEVSALKAGSHPVGRKRLRSLSIGSASNIPSIAVSPRTLNSYLEDASTAVESSQMEEIELYLPRAVLDSELEQRPRVATGIPVFGSDSESEPEFRTSPYLESTLAHNGLMHDDGSAHSIHAHVEQPSQEPQPSQVLFDLGYGQAQESLESLSPLPLNSYGHHSSGSESDIEQPSQESQPSQALFDSWHGRTQELLEPPSPLPPSRVLKSYGRGVSNDNSEIGQDSQQITSSEQALLKVFTTQELLEPPSPLPPSRVLKAWREQ